MALLRHYERGDLDSVNALLRDPDVDVGDVMSHLCHFVLLTSKVFDVEPAEMIDRLFAATLATADIPEDDL